MESVENSLRESRCGPIDLLLTCRPDALTDPDELADNFLRHPARPLPITIEDGCRVWRAGVGHEVAWRLPRGHGSQ